MQGEEHDGLAGAGEQAWYEASGQEAAGHEPPRLDLHEEDRLPWLESAEDYADEAGVDGRKVMTVVLGGLALLAAIVGGVWWGTHRGGAAAGAPADGASVAAPAGAVKEAPKDPGGKTFDGTGDTSFAVSQGQTRPAQLAGEGADGAAKAPAPAQPAAPASAPASSAKPAATAAHPAAAAAPAAADAGGVGVQVGAYGNRAAAEAGWNRLVQHSDLLKGAKHRIVEGQADIGTVYRLQVISGDAASASDLCGKLKAAGIACHVKK
ncbi:MAG: SPOR domain-containing protein [Proteobacteria bacterium]|nr:SPOR domain-containing protein [Pseudomonadota bacterium]